MSWFDWIPGIIKSVANMARLEKEQDRANERINRLEERMRQVEIDRAGDRAATNITINNISLPPDLIKTVSERLEKK